MKKMILGLLIALGLTGSLYGVYQLGRLTGQNEVIENQEIYQKDGKMYNDFNGQVNLYE